MRRRVRVIPALLAATAAALPLGAAPGAAARPAPSPTDPGPVYARVGDRDTRLQLQVMGRPDGRDMVYRISGHAYVNAPGDTLAPKLRHGTKLFNFEGYNIRRLYREPGTDKLWLLSREVVFYTDPQDPTKVLRQWRNPLDGRTYPTVPVNNDHVDFGPYTVTESFRLPALKRIQDDVVQVSDIPPRSDLRTKLGDDFGLQNGIYASWEMFDFFIDRREAERRARGVPRGPMKITNSWTRSSPFPPFMCIAEKDTRATMLYHARSWTLPSWDRLEPWLKAEVERDYPLYRRSPDAPAPTETSWTSFHAKQLDGGKLKWSDWCAQNGKA